MPKSKKDDIDKFLDDFAKENVAKQEALNNEKDHDHDDDDEDEEKDKPPQQFQPGSKHIDDIIAYANDMYEVLKKHVKKNPEFMQIADKKKLDFFRDKLNHKEFMTEFPIVSRYMICMGQYSKKAFKRLLDKISRTIHPPPTQRAKGYMEDQWVRRQADYVRYLWEEYQKKRKAHINPHEASAVWEDAYKSLKGEFDDFRNKYKEIENKTKEEKKTLAGENVQDLLARLSTGKQKLSKEDEELLLMNLKPLLWRKRFTVGPLQEMQTMVGEGKIKYHDTELVSVGTAPEMKERPTITMIEHLAQPERIGEVPQHMLLNPDEPIPNVS